MSNYVEVTRRGIGSRGKDSIGGAFVGLIMVALAVILLFWNEGRAVKRAKDLKEGAGSVVSVASDRVDPAMEGQLVHLTGETKTSGMLEDPEFGIGVAAIKLIREVEMYQWVEVEKSEEKTSVGGTTETTTTYTYQKEWKDSPVDSSRFKVTSGYENPREMKYRSSTLTAEGVTMGAFDLPGFLVSQIGGATPLSVESLDKAAEDIRTGGRLHEGGVYLCANPNTPAVGDMRVSFLSVPTGPISVVAQQAGKTFVSRRTATGGELNLLENGIVSAEEMFRLAHERNKFLTWAIRVGGFFLLSMGFGMVLRPIAVLASILPFLGRIVGTGTTVIAFLLAGILWTMTVAVAWIFYRPLLGIAILVVTVALIVMVVKRLRKPAAAPGLASGPPAFDGPPPLT
jgi:hypothetical protein